MKDVKNKLEIELLNLQSAMKIYQANKSASMASGYFQNWYQENVESVSVLHGKIEGIKLALNLIK